MKRLGLIIISMFIFTANTYADAKKNILIQCDNGVEATINDAQMDLLGLPTLPFKKVAEQDDEKIVTVYGNERADIKVLIQYAGPKVFLQDRGNWIPCNAYRANS